MAVKVLSLVWDGFPDGGSELLALLALADWSDDNGHCWPSISAIAKKMRLSRSQTQRTVHALIDAGFVVVTGNETGGAPGTTRQYRIVLQKLTGGIYATPTGSTGATGRMDATGSTHAQDGSHGCTETGSTGATQTVSEPSTTKTASPSSAPSNPKQVIFTLGVSILTAHGETEKQARSFLAKFAKQNEGKLAEVIGHLATNPKVQAKSYIAGAFKPEERGLVL